MTKPKPKATATLQSAGPELSPTVGETPDQVRAVLWKIALNEAESGTARVAACRLLLMDARERGEGGETRQQTDLNRRAIALLNRVAN